MLVGVGGGVCTDDRDSRWKQAALQIYVFRVGVWKCCFSAVMFRSMTVALACLCRSLMWK